MTTPTPMCTWGATPMVTIFPLRPGDAENRSRSVWNADYNQLSIWEQAMSLASFNTMVQKMGSSWVVPTGTAPRDSSGNPLMAGRPFLPTLFTPVTVPRARHSNTPEQLIFFLCPILVILDFGIPPQNTVHNYHTTPTPRETWHEKYHFIRRSAFPNRIPRARRGGVSLTPIPVP